MSPTLEDQERHLLVKVIDRILYKLDDLVRPYVHKILVVIEPLLIDEDYYARVEGREIISNLAKVNFILWFLLLCKLKFWNYNISIDIFYSRNLKISARCTWLKYLHVNCNGSEKNSWKTFEINFGLFLCAHSSNLCIYTDMCKCCHRETPKTRY